MKAVHMTEGHRLPLKEGSVIIIFEPNEAEVAVWDLELLATHLEKTARVACGTDKLWEVALDVRKKHQIPF